MVALLFSVGCGGTTTSPGSATKLKFENALGLQTQGVTFNSSVEVGVYDDKDRLVTTGTYEITLSVSAPAQSPQITGTLVQATQSGEAVFSDLGSATAGTDYTLTAVSAPSLQSAASAVFQVKPP
jgi:hypothetical protein